MRVEKRRLPPFSVHSLFIEMSLLGKTDSSWILVDVFQNSLAFKNDINISLHNPFIHWRENTTTFYHMI